MIESTLNVEQLLQAVWETVYMTFVSLFFAAIFGLLIGILLYCTQTGGLLQNKVLNRIVDIIVNVLRAIPFLILLILLIPLTRALVGTMLGAKAALPPLIFASTPFFACASLPSRMWTKERLKQPSQWVLQILRLSSKCFCLNPCLQLSQASQ